MDRRRFLKYAGRFLLMAGMLGGGPLGGRRGWGADPGEEGVRYAPGRGPGLEEIAAKKLHHGTDHFLNPFSATSPRNLRRLLKWKLFSRNRYKPLYTQEAVRPVVIDWEPVRRHSGVSVTFLKHSSLLIKDVDAYLLIDPVYFDLFWFIKDFSPLAFDTDLIPKPSHVLITHGHYDHLDRPTLSSLGPGTHLITPLGYDTVFKELGMHRRERLDWFDSYSDGRRRITLLPCNHWTMRNPFRGPNRSLWGAYLIETAGGLRIFISGDTAYFDGFRELGELFDIDLAIFNLGAYEPRWFMAQSHINPAETVQACSELGASQLMIVHWGTFRLGDEPVYLPPQDLLRVLSDTDGGPSLLDIEHGQTVFFDSYGQPQIPDAIGHEIG